ncbi:MAG: metallophosphoesterase family protein [Terricaulis sp.]
MGLLQMFAPSRPPAASFAEARVGYAIGDIHGRADLLVRMFELLEARAEADKREGGEPIVVFLGDYIDRGPNSRAVLDLLIESRPRGFERHYLKGNHEAAMLSFLNEPLTNRAWVVHGGAETLVSYGIKPPPSIGTDDQVWLDVAEKLKAALPQAHMDFIQGLERYVVLGDYAFVHAGIDAARSMEEQTDGDLLWIRERFLTSRKRFSHRIVHGHTPSAEPYADQRRIGVDTGAYASGTLSAVRLEGIEDSFVSVSEPTSKPSRS